MRKLKDHVGERYVYKRIKWDANRAGRSFNISLEWLVDQVHRPCHYCNRVDINSVTVPSKRPGEVLLANFRYNGLDRVDNTLGYEVSNLVPCCVVCNRAKNSMPYDDFVKYIGHLVNYQNSLGDNHVNGQHEVPSIRVRNGGKPCEAGEHPDSKELPEGSVHVFTTQSGSYLYHRPTRRLSKCACVPGGNIEGAVQA